MSILSNLRFSIRKRLYKFHEMRVWRKHDDETRYHFKNPNIDIGEFTYGIPEIIIYDIGVKLKIGKYCSIANGVKILLGGEHPINGVSQFPFNRRKDIFTNYSIENSNESLNVSIGNDVWLGRGAIVLAGVTIGNGAIIGAGAVVSKDIPPYSIAVGCPIKILRKRINDEQIEKLQKIKWWDYSPSIINQLIPYMSNINRFISACYKVNIGGGGEILA